MYKFTMYRDKIEINEKLRSSIMAAISKFNPADPTGRNILLAAREITIEPGYTFALTDCNLTMAGDLVDTSKGTIDISITVQALTGQIGNFGKSVGVICKSWGGIKVNLKGSTGGPGLMGQPGVHGKNGVGQPGKNNGGDGGKGGKGGTGCTGGMGGFVSAYFLNKLTPNATDLSGVVLDGGDGGSGGPGGPGGAGGSGEEWCKPNGTFCMMGTNGKQGAKGDPGVKGAKGVNGGPQFSQVM